MSKWLKVDAAGHSNVSLKWQPSSLPIGNGFTVDFDLFVPAATAAALLAASNPNWAADWFQVGISGAGAPNYGGVYAQVDTGPVLTALNDFTPNPPAGSIPMDAIVHITYEVVFNSGTSWDFTVKINGTTVDIFTRNTGLDTTWPWEFFTFGAPNTGGYTGETYYLSNVIVKDGSGSTIFSDDFTDITLPSSLGPWTSGTNKPAMSIVDSPPTGTDFTISATPTSVTHTTPGSLTIEIDVGQVGAPETVDLTVDDSGLPFGISASLDVSTGTTPYSATLTLTAIAGATCDDGSVIVSGDDGSNTHSVTIPVTIDGTAGTYDELGAAGAQAGSDMSQTGEVIIEGALCVYNSELYWAWVENTDGSSCYVAKWNGSDWDLIADSAIFGGAIADGGPDSRQVRLATDGVNLYFAFEREHEVTLPDCHNVDPDATVDITPYRAECWQFDGTAWALLGYVGGGTVVNDGDASLTSTTLELSAGTDEPGACYVAFFEEGFEGPSELAYWFSRHLTVAGFGTSTLGSVSFDGLLSQMDRPVDELGRCIPPDGAGAQGFSMRLVGTGDNLALYSQAYDYDQFVAPYWSTINVWQPSGIATVTLATDFPSTDIPATVVGYGSPLIVSEQDVAGKRWVGVVVLTTFGSHFRIIRETTAAAPATFRNTFGLADHSADDLQSPIDKLISEPGNLWAVDTGSFGNVLLLTNRCGSTFWDGSSRGYQFPSGIAHSFTGPVIFDDAIWLAGGPGNGGVKAFRVEICRGCGECCALRASPAGLRHHRQRIGAAA